MDCFSDLFDSSIRRLRNAWLIKLDAMKKCSKIQQDYKEKKKEFEAQLGSQASISLSNSDCEVD